MDFNIFVVMGFCFSLRDSAGGFHSAESLCSTSAGFSFSQVHAVALYLAGNAPEPDRALTDFASCVVPFGLCYSM